MLLVDDHAILRSALGLVLGRAGDIAVVGEAGSAEDALAAMPGLAPDVVIMDVRMPGLGGIDGTLAVKELAPGTRVLVLSMLAGAAAELDAALLVNPYDLDGVADAIARAAAMSLAERRERWESMMRPITGYDIHAWCRAFLGRLTGSAG